MFTPRSVIAPILVVDKVSEKDFGVIAADLPEKAECYFVIDENCILLPITVLIHTRVRIEGVNKAAEYMSLAHAGVMPKRQPITVSKYDDERYLINDGNSTVFIARSCGWERIPCHIIKD